MVVFWFDLGCFVLFGEVVFFFDFLVRCFFLKGEGEGRGFVYCIRKGEVFFMILVLLMYCF